MTESKPQLEYSRPMPWHRQRRVRRWFILTLLLGACAVAGWNWRPVWDEVRYLWYWHKLTGIVLPADKVVFEADPAKAQALLQKDPQYHRELFGDTKNVPMVASFAPPYFAEFTALSLPAGGFNFRASAPVIFVGERQRSRDGNKVLLVLRYEGPGIYVDNPIYTFNYDLYGRHVEGANNVMTREASIPCSGPYIDRFFAGQADPTDPTHISFRYAIKGQEGIIDAWLEEQSLRMKVRTGPATRTSLGL
jgi:hypothetical protein